jgi:hypothetical protein
MVAEDLAAAQGVEAESLLRKVLKPMLSAPLGDAIQAFSVSGWVLARKKAEALSGKPETAF